VGKTFFAKKVFPTPLSQKLLLALNGKSIFARKKLPFYNGDFGCYPMWATAFFFFSLLIFDSGHGYTEYLRISFFVGNGKFSCAAITAVKFRARRYVFLF